MPWSSVEDSPPLSRAGEVADMARRFMRSPNADPIADDDILSSQWLELAAGMIKSAASNAMKCSKIECSQLRFNVLKGCV
jgi:hypothetical protein